MGIRGGGGRDQKSLRTTGLVAVEITVDLVALGSKIESGWNIL